MSSALHYAIRRLGGIARGWVRITNPPAGVRVERDVEVRVRDGTILRLNVFRPEAAGRFPVLLSAHPYGKDALPRKGLFGWRTSIQYRAMRQPATSWISPWTTWEAPDPAYWVPRGYAVLNCDLRGFFRSDGVGSVFSRAQGRDLHDVVEWAAQTPWSTGKVGMLGVSYLAITQWLTAAERSPHLAAICPWEGFTDPYRDLCYPGGVREEGFVRFWGGQIKAQPRNHDDLVEEQAARPLWDAWWAERTPDLERIVVPALICGSFSDHNLHSRGSFEAFRRIASRDKWLYTHRDGKWNAFYSDEARALQSRFFDFFLKGESNGMREVPPIRLEVRDVGDVVHEVRAEREWPLARAQWTSLYLHSDGTLRESAAAPGEVRYETAHGAACFAWTAPADTELSGPMKLRLHVEARGADDLLLFVGVRKLRDGREIVFEGSYGFGRDLVTRGWLKASHRQVDELRSAPWRPFLRHDREEKLAPGEVVAVEIELLPSATLFRQGDVLRLDIQGHYFFPRNPLFGQFPAGYEASTPATAALHVGGLHDSHLLVPRIARA
jgi:hypothetical protein